MKNNDFLRTRNVEDNDPKLTEEDNKLRNFSKIITKSGVSRQALTVLMLAPLAACGGNKGSTVPPPPAVPDFTEGPTNTFTARDNNDRILAISNLPTRSSCK